MSEKPEALRLADIFQGQADRDYAFIDDFRYTAAAELRRLHAENERLHDELRQSSIDITRAEVERLKAENERLRELVRHILGDRITPEAYLLFGKAWVDEAHAALRREESV